ncbi:MAG: hypothetical protein QM817_25145 [Archangium sp.]
MSVLDSVIRLNQPAARALKALADSAGPFLEKALGKDGERLFRQPASALQAVGLGLEAVQRVVDAIPFEWPTVSRAEIAAWVSTEGRTLISEMHRGIATKLDEQLRSGASPYLRYAVDSERAVPFVSLFLVSRTLERALDDIANLLPVIREPMMPDDASPEERSRMSLEWARKLIVTVYFPLVAEPLCAFESILRNSRIHANRENAAVSHFNNSIQRNAPGVQRLSEEFVFVRNAMSHGNSVDIDAIGSAVLRDKDEVVELSHENCAALPRRIFRSASELWLAVGLVAAESVTRIADTNDFAGRLGAAIRDGREFDFDFETAELDTRLNAIA